MTSWLGSLRPGPRHALVFVAAFAVLFFAMSREANMFDEGIIYGGALRLLDGQLVHRDFYSVYGPGSYAVLAGLFALLGPGFLLGRLWGLLVAAGIAALVHAIVAARTRPAVALGTAALATLWMMVSPTYLAPIYPCMALTLAAAAVLLRPDALRRSGTLLAAGALSGLTALFRYDAGFFLFACSCLAAVMTALRGVPGRAGRRMAIRAVLLMGVGAGGVFAPFGLWYLVHAPLAAFRHDIIDYTIDYYPRMRGLPFPGPATLLRQPDQIAIYLPLLVVAAALPMIAQEWQHLRGSAERAPVTIPAGLLLGLLAGVLYYKGAIRVSVLHMMMSLIPATALAGIVLDRWTRGPAPLRLLARGAAAAMVLIALSGLRDSLHLFRVYPLRASWLWPAEAAGIVPAPARCAGWNGMRFALVADKYARTAYYLARHSNPADRVLVGLARTDRIFANAMFLNYAANRLPGTHWSQFDPGLQNRRDIQQQMIGELARGDVKWVVRDASPPMDEPNGSALSSGINLIDDYVDAHYRPVGRADDVSIWLRKDMAPAPLDADPPECRLAPA